MSDTEVRSKVQKLLALATDGAGDESRTAAWIAAKLIVQHQLLDNAPSSQARGKNDLHDVAKKLLQVLLDAAWKNRKNPNHFVTVADIIALALRENIIREHEQQVVRVKLGALAAKERDRGILIGKRGRNGGYHLAPNVTRSSS